MPNGRYTITESVGNRRETVHSFEDLEKHHPSTYAEAGRNYAVTNGEREEVSYAGERTFVKKDFILQVDGSAAVDIPSPIGGQGASHGSRHLSNPQWHPGRLRARLGSTRWHRSPRQQLGSL